MGGEQQLAAGVVAQAVERHAVAVDAQLAVLAQLRVVQGGLGQRLQHLGQPTTTHQDEEVLQPAIGAAPQCDLRRLVEQFLDQAVLQLQVVLVDDPPQAAGEAEAVGVVLVVEDEVLGEHVAQQRHRQDVLRQAAQRGAFDQRIRALQVQPEDAPLGHPARRSGGMEIPGQAAGHCARQAQPEDREQAAPALGGGGWTGCGVLAHGIPSRLNI
ncbi:hypothetical protein D3C78_821930 [compost metagenome]